MKNLNELVKIFRVESHKIVQYKNTNGICYLLAHCYNEYLTEIGYVSRKVSGNQALLKQGKKTRYVTYGKFEPSNYNTIGDYHSWCEITIYDRTYVVDTTITYTKNYLKRNGTALSKNIPNTLISDIRSSYYYKYREDISLNHLSEEALSEIPKELITSIVNTALSKARQYLSKF